MSKQVSGMATNVEHAIALFQWAAKVREIGRAEDSLAFYVSIEKAEVEAIGRTSQAAKASLSEKDRKLVESYIRDPFGQRAFAAYDRQRAALRDRAAALEKQVSTAPELPGLVSRLTPWETAEDRRVAVGRRVRADLSNVRNELSHLDKEARDWNEQLASVRPTRVAAVINGLDECLRAGHEVWKVNNLTPPDEEETTRRDYEIVSMTPWRPGLSGSTERRGLLGSSSGGYHYAVEKSRRGGETDSPLGWSEPYKTLHEARSALASEGFGISPKPLNDSSPGTSHQSPSVDFGGPALASSF